MNGAGINVPGGSNALDAIRVWNGAAADEVVAGSRIITDSRGLPIDATAPMSAGSILRLVAKRDRATADAADAADVEG